MIYCDEERHMMQNRSRAFENLEEKLYQRAYEEELNKRQRNRKMQIGSSGRSERIRTYNFIQDRITDHRLDENFQGISRFLSGSNLLDSMIENLHYEHQFDLLNEILESFRHNKKTINYYQHSIIKFRIKVETSSKGGFKPFLFFCLNIIKLPNSLKIDQY